MTTDPSRLTQDAVRATLDRILANPLFVQADRQRRLLRYIVEESLSGRAGRLSQFALGIDVFDRDENFDPAIDSVVRVEVGRLRAKLREYYEAVPGEAVVIRIPKGRYVADFDLPEARDPPTPDTTPPAARKQPTIGVLPFSPMSNDTDDRYFADGFTEDLITDLSKIAGLRVIARQSSFRYRGSNQDMAAIGHELGATHLLEGSVRRAGGRVRINAQLIECSANEHLWAERYDRDMADVFAVQDEVGRRIVGALSVALTAADRYRRRVTDTTSLEAYDAVLRASALSWALDDVFEACRLYDHAISLDPDYATAYAKRANLTWYLWRGGWIDENALDEALTIARRGIDADPESGEAHVVLAFIQFWLGDYGAANASFDAAISRDPGDVRIIERQAICLSTFGRCEEARTLIDRAQSLNPHEPYYFPRAAVAFSEGETDQAITLLQKSSERFTSFLPTRLYLAACYALRDQREPAVEQIGVIRDINAKLSLERLLRGWPGADTSAGMERFHTGFSTAWRWADPDS